MVLHFSIAKYRGQYDLTVICLLCITVKLHRNDTLMFVFNLLTFALLHDGLKLCIYIKECAQQSAEKARPHTIQLFTTEVLFYVLRATHSTKAYILFRLLPMLILEN